MEPTNVSPLEKIRKIGEGSDNREEREENIDKREEIMNREDY